MNQSQQILEKIRQLLLTLGFTEVMVKNPYRNEINYVKGNLYCIPQYIESLGFLIEYADSYETAKNHGHEDGDAFPLSWGETSILNAIEKDLQQNIRDIDQPF